MSTNAPKSLHRDTSKCPGSDQKCPIPCALCAWPRPSGKTLLELCRVGTEWEAHVIQVERLSMPILHGTGIELKDSLVEPEKSVL